MRSHSQFTEARRRAKTGDPEGQYDLAVCYEFGRGVQRDFEEALAYMISSAKQGHEPARRWLECAARSGSSEAAAILAFMNRFGWGGDIDRAAELVWKRMAAESGDHDFLRELAINPDAFRVRSGETNDQIIGSVLPHLERFSRETNCGIGYLRLAQFFESECGDAPDRNKAVSYYLKAAKAGDADAINYMGWKLRQFALDADSGDHGAQLCLGECFANGWGCRRDSRKALQCFNAAAQGGSSEGQFRLAQCYAIGFGTKRDQRKAFDWFTKAAQQGHTEAIPILNDQRRSGNRKQRYPIANTTGRPSRFLEYARAERAALAKSTKGIGQVEKTANLKTQTNSTMHPSREALSCLIAAYDQMRVALRQCPERGSDVEALKEAIREQRHAIFLVARIPIEKRDEALEILDDPAYADRAKSMLLLSEVD